MRDSLKESSCSLSGLADNFSTDFNVIRELSFRKLHPFK